MKKNLKNEKAITLIALVITIIVLLILAGISIATLTGQNGILTQAQNAKTTTENKSAEEKVKLAILAARTQSDTGTLEADKLVEEVQNQGGTAETTAGGFLVTVIMDGKTFTVDVNGNVEPATSKPQITEVKIVTSEDGIGEDVSENQSETTVLYISFKASLENGTINSVTCDNGTVENKNGIYVTKITANGTYKFTITGTGKNGITTITVPLKVKKYENNILSASDIAAMTDKSKIYGATVTGYTLPSGTTTDVGWKIFYADDSNIYLIADNYVERASLPNSTDGAVATDNKPDNVNSGYKRAANFINLLGDYAGSSRITDNKLKALNNDYFNIKGYKSKISNMKSVAYMMDIVAWNSKFKDTNNKANYVIGGPSVELLFKSYNDKYKTKTAYESQATNTTGYQIRKTSSDNWVNYISMLSTSDPLYVITKQTDALAYWLGSPSAEGDDFVMQVDYTGNVSRNYYYTYDIGFRPLVCLKYDIQLQKNSDGTYNIK